MKVVVGSQNQPKRAAVEAAFRQVWPSEPIEVVGVAVESGVADQPMNDTESLRGARNRAAAAAERQPADYTVGLEGGLHELDGTWYESTWVAVRDASGREGVGSSVRMELAPQVMELVRQGHEMGEAIDILFAQTGLRHGQGYFGTMTHGHITRATGLRDGVISALIRFLEPEVFEPPNIAPPRHSD